MIMGFFCGLMHNIYFATTDLVPPVNCNFFELILFLWHRGFYTNVLAFHLLCMELDQSTAMVLVSLSIESEL